MRYVVLTFLCTIAIIAYVQRLGVQTAYTPISREFQLNTEDLGSLGTAFLIGYALLQVPAGWLADRIGSRNALAGLALLWSILAGSLGACESFTSLKAMWFTVGLAMAGVFPCAAKSIGAWFPDTEKATASGLLGSFTMLGTAAASFITGKLLNVLHWSWQWIYIYYGAAGVIWAVVYLATVPERVASRTVSPPMTHRDWGRLLTSIPLWFLCGQHFFRAGAMIFFINWFPKFIEESRGLNPKVASEYAAYVNIAALLGGTLGGLFSDWLFRRTGLRRLSRQGIAVGGMIAAAIVIVTTFYVANNQLVIVLFSIGAFVATFGGVSGYTVAIEFGGQRIGVVFSMMNMCGSFGAAIVNQTIGTLKERTGSWNTALVAIAVILAVDAVCWALLNPRRPLFEDEHEPS